MAHLDLLRTIHCPVTADGRIIVNSFGVEIAYVKSREPFEAEALAQLINLGSEVARQQQLEYEAREQKARDLFVQKNNL